MKKEIKIGSFFRGSEKYGEELIKAFEDAGGDNFLKYTGRDEDVTRPQFPSIFKVVPCISFTPLISPEDGEEYAYILTKEQMKTIDETLKELL